VGSVQAVWSARERDHLAWWRRNVLTPLIAATRPLDLRTPEAVDDTTRAWVLALAEIPQAVLEPGVARLLTTCGKWMPAPSDLRAACAEVVAERRRALAERHAAMLATCECSGAAGWVEVDGAMARCSCWRAGMALYEGMPEPIALPAAREDEVTA
jgi:hypothetical protein